MPISYIDATGTVSPYTDADKTDTYKQHLTLSYNQEQFEKSTDPNLSIALFADRILDYVPDYTKKGYLIRRTAASPYFGMELNIKL